jgi:(5-formylfuran-3-yl)methyl phosphate synthase
MRLLVSVRNPAEAALAASAGVHFIDLKEPRNGALGGLPLSTIAEVVDVLRRQAAGARISATIGDWPADAWREIEAQVRAVAACGVDYVKVGIAPGPAATRLVDHLGDLQAHGIPLVPVFIADDGVSPALVTRALRHGFPALMLDTQDKGAGDLFRVLSRPLLWAFVQEVQAAGCLAGLAGALTLERWADLVALSPDFAGFRSAVCAGDRAGALDPARLARLIQQARDADQTCAETA